MSGIAKWFNEKREHFEQGDEMIKVFGVVVNPLVLALNGVVETINGATGKAYENCIDLSNTVSSKMKEYADSMKSDKEENPDNVSIPEAHKNFFDKLAKSDKYSYDLLAEYGKSVMRAKVEDQAKIIAECLVKYAVMDLKVKEEIDKLTGK
jgi:hypothetical protein